MTRPALVPLWAVVLLLLALVVATTALMIGSRALDRPGAGGLLVYSLGSDVYLAEADGAKPRQLLIRAGNRAIRPCQLSTTTGSIWAPNGRFFLCFDWFPSFDAQIVDSEGRLVASVPNVRDDATWSPNSEQLQAWIDATRIGIYGIDGALDASLSLPDGYTQLTGTGAAWAGDGRSVVVQIHRGAGALETWRLPIDGSAPSLIAEDDALANPDFSFTRDGGRLAFTRAIELGHHRALYLANADGTDVRVIRQGARTPFKPIWSPDGTHIAFLDVEVRDMEAAVETATASWSWTCSPDRTGSRFRASSTTAGRASAGRRQATGSFCRCPMTGKCVALERERRRHGSEAARRWRERRRLATAQVDVPGLDRARRSPKHAAARRSCLTLAFSGSRSPSIGRLAGRRCTHRGRWNDYRHARLIPVVSFH